MTHDGETDSLSFNLVFCAHKYDWHGVVNVIGVSQFVDIKLLFLHYIYMDSILFWVGSTNKF